MKNTNSGVDYGTLKVLKELAMKEGVETDRFAKRLGFEVVPWSRGRSAFLAKHKKLKFYIALVLEGLGTKNAVADAYATAAQMAGKPLKKFLYDWLAQCNTAMAFNDLSTSGASPLLYANYLALQSAEWAKNGQRNREYVGGTALGCMKARCVYGPGEIPELDCTIVPDRSDLAGAVVGFIFDEKHLINPANIKKGDAIVFVESSGFHANGFTRIRDTIPKMPQGYLTKLSDGRTISEAVLAPTLIYSELVDTCLDYGVKLHDIENVTGGGLGKLMRPTQSFEYVITKVPEAREEFVLIQKYGERTDKQMYQGFNMGAGYAFYLPKSHVAKVVAIAGALGLLAYEAGHIESSRKKRVVVEPKGFVIDEADL